MTSGPLTRALVLAAGRGVSIGGDRNGDPGATSPGPNCLVRVGGVPLLERTLRVLAAAGIRSIAITIGWQGDRIRGFLAASGDLVAALGLDVTVFENPAWDKPNGLSVQAARAFVRDERVLLVMADQIVAPALVAEMARAPGRAPAAARTLLGVDRDLARVFDIDDATKVQLGDAHLVTGISKQLAAFDAVSAGLFVMAPSLLEALDRLPEPSLTEGVAEAARAGLVEAHDVGTQLWQDVDSPEMRLHAEWLLRVYGAELAGPAVTGAPVRPEADTMALVERLLAARDVPGYVLLNPGPVMTSARVKASLVHHDVCHRDEDYSGVVRRLQEKLRPVFGASPEHEMLLLTGSGTAAMEMSICGVVPEGGKLLVISNGAFGERLGEIAALHGIETVALRYAWGELPRPRDVTRALAADARIAAVAMIQHETSVGVLNPVRAIGAICRERGQTLVVDSVSALGAEELDVVRDGVGICYSSANKCLHSVSGVSFLCVAPEVWPRVEAIRPRVYYLDLLRYRRYQRDLAQTPFTPAVSAFFALETALDELAEAGGVPARRELYRKRCLRIRRVLRGLGFESFTNTGRESQTISTLALPDFLEVGSFYDALKARGFVIYKCKGDLAARCVQISNMGELPDATIDAFLAAATEIVEAARRAAGAPAPVLSGKARARTA